MRKPTIDNHVHTAACFGRATISYTAGGVPREWGVAVSCADTPKTLRAHFDVWRRGCKWVGVVFENRPEVKA